MFPAISSSPAVRRCSPSTSSPPPCIDVSFYINILISSESLSPVWFFLSLTIFYRLNNFTCRFEKRKKNVFVTIIIRLSPRLYLPEQVRHSTRPICANFRTRFFRHPATFVCNICNLLCRNFFLFPIASKMICLKPYRLHLWQYLKIFCGRQ